MRPPARSPCCGPAAKEAPTFLRVWKPRSAPHAVRAGPALSPSAVPALPGPRAPESGTEHPQVLSSLLVPLSGKLSAAAPGAGQPGPARPRERSVRGSYLRPRGFAEPPPPVGLAQRSGPRSSAAAAACSRSLPSRYPGNRLLLPPGDQSAPFTWRPAANEHARHPGPLPGSRTLSQARGPEREAGVSPELLLLESGPPGVGGRNRVICSRLLAPFFFAT